MDKRTTDKLENILNNINKQDDLEDYLNDENNIINFDNFVDYYLSLDKVKQLDRSELIKKSNLERTYAYQILNKTRLNPGKDKILCLCIAAKLNLKESLRALEIVGENLYARNSRDAIIIFAINNNLDLMETNYLLDKYNEEILR